MDQAGHAHRRGFLSVHEKRLLLPQQSFLFFAILHQRQDQHGDCGKPGGKQQHTDGFDRSFHCFTHLYRYSPKRFSSSMNASSNARNPKLNAENVRT